MGCGVSKTSVTSPVSAEGDAKSDPSHLPNPVEDQLAEGVKNQDNKEPISVKSFSTKSMDSDDKSSSSTEEESTTASPAPAQANGTNEQGNERDSNMNIEMKKGYVAFEVPLDDSKTLENVLRKPLPRRLRHLEPLGNAPQITTEKLMEKLEKAEEKRQRALERYKRQSSRRKELAMRRNEQMGDVLSSAQMDDMNDSDQSVTEKSEAPKTSADSNDITANPGNAAANWNGVEHALDTMKSPQVNSDGADQNNNNIEHHIRHPSTEYHTNLSNRHGCFLNAVQEEDEDDETSCDDYSYFTESLQSSEDSSRVEKVRFTKPRVDDNKTKSRAFGF